MKYKYQTKSKSDLIVLILDGERVNLVGGSAEITLPSTKRKPAQKVLIRPLADADVEKLLSNPDKYGDWSEKFIDLESGYPPKFTIKGPAVKKSPVAAIKAKAKKVEAELEKTEQKPKAKPKKSDK